ncbi:MAG: adenylate kinase [Halodesulfurarchaeum sp.]
MPEPRVLLLGAPGAGKGTQAERLTEAFDIEHVTTGDALRENKDMETEYGTPRSFMEAGELVPDPVVNEIVETAIEDAEGFVLDGYPRNESQLEHLEEVTDLDAVIYLAVDESELIERITGRRVCSECGRNYHLTYDPPAEEGVCEACGGELYQREDDTEATARDRIAVYEESTAPVVRYYRETGDLIEIDGGQAPDDVFEDVRQAVATRLEGA